MDISGHRGFVSCISYIVALKRHYVPPLLPQRHQPRQLALDPHETGALQCACHVYMVDVRAKNNLHESSLPQKAAISSPSITDHLHQISAPPGSAAPHPAAGPSHAPVPAGGYCGCCCAGEGGGGGGRRLGTIAGPGPRPRARLLSSSCVCERERRLERAVLRNKSTTYVHAYTHI